MYRSNGLTFTLLFYFFFQAEDGIRDLTVTGVQTCALPIWGRERTHRVVRNNDPNFRRILKLVERGFECAGGYVELEESLLSVDDGFVRATRFAEDYVVALTGAIGDEDSHRGDGNDPVSWATAFMDPGLFSAFRHFSSSL